MRYTVDTVCILIKISPQTKNNVKETILVKIFFLIKIRQTDLIFFAPIFNLNTVIHGKKCTFFSAGKMAADYV